MDRTWQRWQARCLVVAIKSSRAEAGTFGGATIAARYATARAGSVTTAVFSLKLDRRFSKVVGDAVLGEYCFETLVLEVDFLALSCRFREDLLESQHFLLQRLDVLLFALPVGAVVAVNIARFQSQCITHRWACLLSSWRRVMAGLLSGLGPLRFAGCPSVHLSVSLLRIFSGVDRPLVAFLSPPRFLRKGMLPRGLLSLAEPLTVRSISQYCLNECSHWPDNSTGSCSADGEVA